MKTISLNYDDIHELVDHRQNMFWDGWTLVLVDTSKYGLMNKNGIFFNGKWHTQTRIEPDSHGMWRIPIRHV